MPVQQKNSFANWFLRSHFLLVTKILKTSQQNSYSYEKGSLGKDIPSVGILVGLLLALTWQAASALLGLASLPSTSWCGFCQRLDWSPYWLGARTMGLFLESSGLGAQLRCKWQFGVLEKNFRCQWLACSNLLACSWWSLEGLLAATQNWPISYQKVLVKLVGILVLKTTVPRSASRCSCQASIEDRLMNS